MAQATMQRWIDAKERVATLDYGLRSLKGASDLRGEIARFTTNRERYESRLARYIEEKGAEAAERFAHETWTRNAEYDALSFRAFERQRAAAVAEAELMIGRPLYGWDQYALRRALKQAREELKAIEAEKKAIGGIRQLRLALAECHELPLAA